MYFVFSKRKKISFSKNFKKQFIKMKIFFLEITLILDILDVTSVKAVELSLDVHLLEADRQPSFLLSCLSIEILENCIL